MRATPLLLGCLLSFGAIANATAGGVAAASTMSTASSCSCTNQSSGHAVSHEASSSNGDALNIPHSVTPSVSSSRSTSTSSSSTDESTTHLGGSDTIPTGSSHGSGLSWQSLLPGSIQ
jgi:hypothetical protein